MSIGSARRGATLVEVMLAVGLFGFAMLACVMLLRQLDDARVRIVRDAVADNTAGNADRILRRTLADARAAADSSERFEGTERSATFMSSCDTPSGWSESCRVTLLLDSLADSTNMLLGSDRGDQYVVLRMPGEASLRYLDFSALADSTWLRGWARSIAPPGAIGVVNGADTTVLPLGIARE